MILEFQFLLNWWAFILAARFKITWLLFFINYGCLAVIFLDLLDFLVNCVTWSGIFDAV